MQVGVMVTPRPPTGCAPLAATGRGIHSIPLPKAGLVIAWGSRGGGAEGEPHGSLLRGKQGMKEAKSSMQGSPAFSCRASTQSTSSCTPYCRSYTEN